ncbi:MAG TPA: selenocysteine-specific translation elongation factor [Mycobacteriales bacterium]|nr:selenocysteine-specific translation elongation factor [Mycobacteriales bacterium]
MDVVATAGHVDHGKSALVRALTGRDPDRYAEEHRRGMTLDLGFAWTTLPSGREMAFVDVPGHERFVATMLAGVGPVPAILLVVAADEGWQQQTEEHVAALDALGAREGLIVVTKSDRADAQPVIEQVQERLAGMTLADLPAVAVSSLTGLGMTELRDALDALADRLAAPDPSAPVRLWVDRSFTIRGAGTVVTGTLGAGSLSVGDELVVVPSGQRVTVKGLQSQERAESHLIPVSRAAVNLRGVDREAVGRGDALVTPGAWTMTAEVDVSLAVGQPRLPAELVVHIGSAAVPARVRPLDPTVTRLRLRHALPLHVGDRLLLRDPGSRVVTAADVVDVAPLPLTRRGAAARLAQSLAADPSAAGAVQRRGAVRADELVAAGYDEKLAAPGERIGEWWVDPAMPARWREAVAEHLAGLDAETALLGIPLDELRRRAGIPEPALLDELVIDPRWVVADGRVRPAAVAEPELPELAALVDRLRRDPLDAPPADELAIAPSALAHGVRTRRLLHLGRGVYVSPLAPDHAIEVLTGLPQPFTMSEARQALGVSRRVCVPLLEHLDALRRTRRVDDTHRQVIGRD